MMTRLQQFLNSPVRDVTRMGRAPKMGDLFGLELECEGKRVGWEQDDDLLSHWRPLHDGSLRAYQGVHNPCEWVFNGPVSYEQSRERVHKLFAYFKKRKSELHCSNRTSTHVHYNVGDKQVYQVVNLYILFTIVEGLLDRYCGEDREGNLFCLSSRHAEQQIQWIMGACFDDFSFGNLREDWRYCSLNVASLNKFGTVEFRGMRGLSDEEDILSWLSIVNELCTFACYTMKNPVDLVQDLSMKGSRDFLSAIFSPENVFRLTQGLSEYEVSQSLYEGMRLVQMMSYKIGTEFDQVRIVGKDFWNSFGDREVELDVDPELIEAPKPRRPQVNPFNRAPEARPQPRWALPEQNILQPPPDVEAAMARIRARDERLRAEEEEAVALEMNRIRANANGAKPARGHDHLIKKVKKVRPNPFDL